MSALVFAGRLAGAALALYCWYRIGLLATGTRPSGTDAEWLFWFLSSTVAGVASGLLSVRGGR